VSTFSNFDRLIFSNYFLRKEPAIKNAVFHAFTGYAAYLHWHKTPPPAVTSLIPVFPVSDPDTAVIFDEDINAVYDVYIAEDNTSDGNDKDNFNCFIAVVDINEFENQHMAKPAAALCKNRLLHKI